jgi:hypothetical protein
MHRQAAMVRKRLFAKPARDLGELAIQFHLDVLERLDRMHRFARLLAVQMEPKIPDARRRVFASRTFVLDDHGLQLFTRTLSDAASRDKKSVGSAKLFVGSAKLFVGSA